jgi:type I restriction enzyme M protein
MWRTGQDYSSEIFGFAEKIPVSSLPEKDAENLITKPLAGKVVYHKDASDKLLQLTARQPYLIQCLCNTLFSLLIKKETRIVTQELVIEAADKWLSSQDHFEAISKMAETDVRKFIVTLVNQKEEMTTMEIAESLLVEHNMEIEQEKLHNDIKFLCDLELLEYNGKKYRILLPLLGKWLEKQDFTMLKGDAQQEIEDATFKQTELTQTIGRTARLKISQTNEDLNFDKLNDDIIDSD